MTRFEEGGNELRSPPSSPRPGEVTTNPAREGVYRHTFAHELFHAVAPMLTTNFTTDRPTMCAITWHEGFAVVAEDALGGKLDTLKVQEWTRKVCGHVERTTVRRPTRCLKCVRPLQRSAYISWMVGLAQSSDV